MYISISVFNNFKSPVLALIIGVSVILLSTTSFAQKIKVPNEDMEVFDYPDPVLDTISQLSDLSQFQEAWDKIKELQNRFLGNEQSSKNDSIAYLLSIQYQVNILTKNDQFDKAQEYIDKSKQLIDDWNVTNNIIIAYQFLRLAAIYGSMDLETQDKEIEASLSALEAYKRGPYQNIKLYIYILSTIQTAYSYSSSSGSTDSTLKYLDIQKAVLQNSEFVRDISTSVKDGLHLGYVRLYSNSGDFSKAISYGLETMNTMDRREVRGSVFDDNYQENLFWLCVNYYYNKQYKESIYHTKNLIGIMKEEESVTEYDRVQYYNLMGINNEGLNQLDSAMLWYKKCIGIIEAEEINNNVYAGLLLNISSVQARTGDFKSSESNLKKSLKLNKRIYGTRHSNHSNFYRYFYDHYRLAGDQEKALYYIDSALWALEPTHNEGFISTPTLKSNQVTFETLEILHLQMLQQMAVYKKKPEQRKEYLDAIITRAQAIQKVLDDKRNSLNESESVLLHSEWFKSAYETVLEALNILYSQSGEIAYLDQAMGYLSSGKSRLLVDEMGEFRLINSKDIPEALRSRFLEAKREVERLDNELNRLMNTSIDSDSIRILNSQKFEWNNQFNQIRQTLTTDYEPSDPLLSPVSDLDQIKNLYTTGSENEVILEYFMGEHNITILALSRSQKQFFQVSRDSLFNETLDGFLEQVSSKGNTSLTELKKFQDRAYALYQKLLESVLKTFDEDISKLTIIADDKLNLLPFELLVTKKEPGLTNFRNCHYLIRDYIISYQLSASNMKVAPAKSKGSGILAFGYEGTGISDERAKLGGLPGSLEEIKYLKSNFRGRYYSGGKGDKQRFLKEAGDYDILHLALHGKADLSNRFNSALIFNGETDYNLNTYDLYRIKLNPSMVVLSACESGLGKLSTAEGAFSVARGFASVGVPSIVTTLWKVNDQVGADIVKKFYENLKEGLNKDEALQKAKLDFLESADSNTAHPYFWGSFIVIGDTTPVELKAANNSIWYSTLLALLILTTAVIIYRRRKVMGS